MRKFWRWLIILRVVVMSNPGDDLIDNMYSLDKHIKKLEQTLMLRNVKIAVLKDHIKRQDQALAEYRKLEIDLHNAIAQVKQLAHENKLLHDRMNHGKL